MNWGAVYALCCVFRPNILIHCVSFGSRVSVTSRPRRPDRAVYVPRARRSQTTPPASTPNTASTNSVSQLPSNTNVSSPKNLEPTLSSGTAPEGASDPPRTRSSAPSSPAAKQTLSTNNNNAQQLVSLNSVVQKTLSNDSKTNGVISSSKTINCDKLNQNQSLGEDNSLNTTSIPKLAPSNINQLLTPNQAEIMERNDGSDKVSGVGLRIEDAQFEQQPRHNAKEDKDEKELQRASKVSIQFRVRFRNKNICGVNHSCLFS